MQWERVELADTYVAHATTGPQPPDVVFLHGWGIGPHAYAGALDALAAVGCTLVAPGLPGFGGTPPLPSAESNFEGYARWAARYLDAVSEHPGECARSDGTAGPRRPVVVVGHSFGGGVALQFAHDYPDRVAGLVLCSPVGGALDPGHGAGPIADGGGGGGGGRPGADRPLWRWGHHLGSDVLALPNVTRVLPAVLTDAVPNLVRHPVALWRVAGFVRQADLLAEAGVVGKRGVPITAVWSDRDAVVPYSSFSALCRAAGVRGVVVPGNHSWLIARPNAFADLAWRALVDAGTVERALRERGAAAAAA